MKHYKVIVEMSTFIAFVGSRETTVTLVLDIKILLSIIYRMNTKCFKDTQLHH